MGLRLAAERRPGSHSARPVLCRVQGVQGHRRARAAGLRRAPPTSAWPQVDRLRWGVGGWLVLTELAVLVPVLAHHRGWQRTAGRTAARQLWLREGPAGLLHGWGTCQAAASVGGTVGALTATLVGAGVGAGLTLDQWWQLLEAGQELQAQVGACSTPVWASRLDVHARVPGAAQLQAACRTAWSGHSCAARVAGPASQTCSGVAWQQGLARAG